MKKLLLFLLTFTFTLSSFSQVKKDYYDASWYLDFNGGLTWHNTDVSNKMGGGLGLMLGKTYNRRYGSLLTFDLRARYLYGQWKGQDATHSNFEYLSPVLSQGSTNYEANLTYAINNFLVKNHKLNLEFAINAHRLRETKKIELGIFGGIGLALNRTYGDLLDANGALYDYNSLAPDSKKGDVYSMLDYKYETALSSTKLSIYPSLGFNIGWAFHPNASIGLSHKTTFTLNDNFDAVTKPTGNRENDIYHYSNIYLRFYLKGSQRENTNDPTKPTKPVQPPVVHNPNTPTVSNRLPVVQFRNPSISGQTVTTASFNLQATAHYSDQVSLFHNGYTVTNFSFNKANSQVSAYVQLVDGQNTFEIVGTNAYGSDRQITVIYLNEPRQQAPIIQYQNPPITPYTVNANSFSIVANIYHVQYASQVQFSVNGQNFNQFSFDPNTTQFNATIPLIYGNNTVTITATNQSGRATESVVLNYVRQREDMPVVTFTNPSFSPYTHTASNFVLEAAVYNVLNSQNLVFKHNGVVNTNFTFNPYTNSFSSSVVLSAGQNIFELIGSNSSGSRQANTIIVYERAATIAPPVITYTNPAVNPYSTQVINQVLAANIYNVSQKADIQFYLNNVATTNFVFNINTKQLSANLKLKVGSNVVRIVAKNAAGSVARETTIFYEVPTVVLPPQVQIITPNTNPFTSTNAVLALMASISNLEDMSGSFLSVNGTQTTNYSFNMSTNALNSNINLVEGANLIVIRGTNSAGSDEEQLTVYYRKPVSGTAPIVEFVNPSTANSTVTNPVQALVARVQNVTTASQIQVKINGVISNDFDFIPSSQSVKFNATLSSGSNIIAVKGTNAYGSDEETATIHYKEVVTINPPTVTITAPSNELTVSQNIVQLTAQLTNVSSNEQVFVSVNSNTNTNFSYNVNTGLLSASITLSEGQNVILVKAVTIAGQAQDQKIVIYKKVERAPKPTVVITAPTQLLTIKENKYTFKAKVTNANSIQEIQVRLNGQIQNTGYTFNVQTGEVVQTPVLTLGSNTWEVSVTNSGGTASANAKINYSKPVVICSVPEIILNNPMKPGNKVTSDLLFIRGVSKFTKNMNELSVLLNGEAVVLTSFEALDGTFSAKVTLKEGLNSISVSVRNECGSDSETTSIIYEAEKAPCQVPIVTIIDASKTITTLETSYPIKASVSNVNSSSDIKVLVNGTPQTFTYNAASKIVSLTVALQVGNNKVEFQAATDCGASSSIQTIVRSACKSPVITIVNASTSDGAKTTASAYTLNAHISEVSNQSQITVTHNGAGINFVYSPSSSQIALDRNLVVGKNTFVITAKNNCGTSSKTLTITREVVQVLPPQVTIVDPSTTPFYVSEPNFTFKIQTQNITSSAQVIIKVDGVLSTFAFNPATGAITLPRTLQVGANTLNVVVSNASGSATAEKVVFYREVVQAKAPSIFVSYPTPCPAVLPVGSHTITGYVANVSSANQVSIKLNGVQVTNISPNMSNGMLYFSVPLSLVANNPTVVLSITATNNVGSDTKTCNITVSAAQQAKPSVPAPSKNASKGTTDKTPPTGGSGVDTKTKVVLPSANEKKETEKKRP